LERGLIDAWAGFDPGITEILTRHPTIAVLADARSEEGLQKALGTSFYPGAVLYTAAAWLKENPASARGLAQAIKEALAWIHTHKVEEVAAIVPEEFAGADRARYATTLRNAVPMYSPDGLMNIAGAQAVRGVLATSLQEVRNPQFDLSKTFTNEFVEGRIH
jgi:NitT/TauT family transport system substrate-binding protein